MHSVPLRIIAIAACLFAGTAWSSQGLLVTLNPDADGIAWSEHTEFQPRGMSIRGIPVRQLRSDWCKASEFTLQAFPDSARRHGRYGLDQLMSTLGATFSTSGTFGTGKRLDVLLGVFETCQGQRANFLLVLDPERAGQDGIVQLEEISKRATFVYLQTDRTGESFWTVSCFACDDPGTRYRWDPRRGRFVADPHIEEFN